MTLFRTKIICIFFVPHFFKTFYTLFANHVENIYPEIFTVFFISFRGLGSEPDITMLFVYFLKLFR